MRGGGRGGGGGGVETRVEGQKEAPACLTHGVEGRAAWHGDGALLGWLLLQPMRLFNTKSFREIWIHTIKRSPLWIYIITISLTCEST
jgi:hypothetical protein